MRTGIAVEEARCLVLDGIAPLPPETVTVPDALGRVLAAFSRLPAVPRAFLLGLSTTLVPCGWLYAFVATAAGTGGVVPALGVMLAFWTGTLPALVVGAFGLRGLFARVGARGRAVSAALVAVSGVLLLAWARSGYDAPSPSEEHGGSDMKRVNPSCQDESFFNLSHAKWVVGVLSMLIAVVGKDSLVGLILRQARSEIVSIVRDEDPAAQAAACYENN